MPLKFYYFCIFIYISSFSLICLSGLTCIFLKHRLDYKGIIEMKQNMDSNKYAREHYKSNST